MNEKQLAKAYQHCQDIAKQHYENFPVASKFLAKNIRQPISVIYAFARSADDFADEGDLSNRQRLQLLTNYQQQLRFISSANITELTDPIFIALKDVIQKFQLPIVLFQHLLSAFEQDVKQYQYQNRHELLNYCIKSANPIGQLMLYLHDQASTLNLQYSDHICTALQLINFLQDLQQDANESKRLYIPLSEIEKLKLNPSQLIARIKSGASYTPNEYLLLKQQIQYAEQQLIAGTPLIKHLSGSFKFEISLIINSGMAILQKLKQLDSFSQRPRLNHSGKIIVLFKSIQTLLQCKTDKLKKI